MRSTATYQLSMSTLPLMILPFLPACLLRVVTNHDSRAAPRQLSNRNRVPPPACDACVTSRILPAGTVCPAAVFIDILFYNWNVLSVDHSMIDLPYPPSIHKKEDHPPRCTYWKRKVLIVSMPTCYFTGDALPAASGGGRPGLFPFFIPAANTPVLIFQSLPQPRKINKGWWGKPC